MQQRSGFTPPPQMGSGGPGPGGMMRPAQPYSNMRPGPMQTQPGGKRNTDQRITMSQQKPPYVFLDAYLFTWIIYHFVNTLLYFSLFASVIFLSCLCTTHYLSFITVFICVYYFSLFHFNFCFYVPFFLFFLQKTHTGMHFGIVTSHILHPKRRKNWQTRFYHKKYGTWSPSLKPIWTCWPLKENLMRQ